MTTRSLPALPRALAPALPDPEPIVLAAVGRRLLDRGCTAELADVGCAGELDIRLLVGRGDSPVSVELLGPCDGGGRPDRWCAVRIDADGVACLWAGPARPCPEQALAAFVEDLLAADPRSLTGRYLTVG